MTGVLIAALALGGLVQPAYSSPPRIVAEPYQVNQDGGTPVVPARGATPISESLATSGLNPSASPAGPITLAINQLLLSEQGIFGVVLMEPDGTIIYSRNADTPFISASLYKLILLADICRAIDKGELALGSELYVDAAYFTEIDSYDAYFDASYAGYDTTIEEALFAAGAYSSNVAAKALLTLTSTEELNATAAALGLDHTFLFTDPESTPNWPPTAKGDLTVKDALTIEALVMNYAIDGQVNLTTPRDMARFFQLLLRGKIFGKAVSTMILDILKQQMVDNRFPVLLPADTEMAHKTGNLDFVVHDVGVIYSPHGTRILVAMVEAAADDDRAAGIVQRLALIAYGTLDVPPLPLLAAPAGDGTGRDFPRERDASQSSPERSESSTEEGG